MYTTFNRSHWMNQIGVVGGIYGFYASIIAVVVGYFSDFDYRTTIIKKLFIEKQSDKRFYSRFLNDNGTQKRQKKNCCEECFSVYVEPTELKEYQDTIANDNNKVKASLLDGNVDKSDIMTIIFEIFSKRKEFDYALKERLMLYFGFLAPVFKCLRCRCYDHMIQVNKIFEKAVGRLDDECDIIDVMDQIRKSKNFQRNFLTRQQKILLKFDHSNVIDA